MSEDVVSFFTLGQKHEHDIPGLRKMDRNTVVKMITRGLSCSPREAMIELCGREWSREFDEKPDMSFYPGGVVRVDYSSWKKLHGDEFTEVV